MRRKFAEGLDVELKVVDTTRDHAITPLIKKATISRLPDFDSSRMAVIVGRADVLADDADGGVLFAESNTEFGVRTREDTATVKMHDAADASLGHTFPVRDRGG